MPFQTREQLDSFVASLAVPEDRREIVGGELRDHVASALAEGASLSIALAQLGDPVALRTRLEQVEPAFRFTHRAAFRSSAGASCAVVGAALAAASVPFPEWIPEFLIAAIRGLAPLVTLLLLVPPGLAPLLRAEMRAPKIRASIGFFYAIPIGPAFTWNLLLLLLPFALTMLSAAVLDRALTLAALEALAVVFAVSYVRVLGFGIQQRRERAREAKG